MDNTVTLVTFFARGRKIGRTLAFDSTGKRLPQFDARNTRPHATASKRVEKAGKLTYSVFGIGWLREVAS
jgi:hypothetical protein